MTERLRFAEAVCAGHPDRLADTIAERIVALALERDPDALVGVEVALHRGVVFVDGRVAAGERQRRGRGGGGHRAPGPPGLRRRRLRRLALRGSSAPSPEALDVRLDLCLGAAGRGGARHPRRQRRPGHLRGPRRVGATRRPPPPRAGPGQRLRRGPSSACVSSSPGWAWVPTASASSPSAAASLVGVSLSVHHAPRHRLGGPHPGRAPACEAVAQEYVDAGELEPSRPEGGLARERRRAPSRSAAPRATTASRARSSWPRPTAPPCPIGGGAVHGKDPRKVDPRGQALARQKALDAVIEGRPRRRPPCGWPTARATSSPPGRRSSWSPTTRRPPTPSSGGGRRSPRNRRAGASRRRGGATRH